MKINTRIDPDHYIRIEIQPEGYWSEDHITITKSALLNEDGHWDLAEISAGAGGQDGTLDSIDCAITKAIALRQAAKIARNLDLRY